MKKDKKDYRGIYAEMVEVLGEDIVKVIHKYYKGQQINLPMKLYSNEYVEKYIIENKDKKILREMARDLGYSDRWVKKLMNKLNKE
ncbi:Mor transcription activator family protein [Romboutsia timonensis]|uniref:Mor transcription activator family protein n=1 Tax=Romboutsia timonensis TaxID=1776391 RepID=UPI0039934C02